MLAGLTFCVSGEFSCSQSEMKAMLVRGGGKVASTVSASVDYLVCNTPGSTKYQAALDKDKPVVTEQFIRQSLTQGKLATDSSSLFLFNPEGGRGRGGGGMDDGRRREGEGGEGGEEQVFRGCVFALDDGSEAAAEFESYGARVVTEFSPAVQYVLASDVGSPLTLQAVAAGVPVVHSEWVAECLTEGELLDPWTFPMGDGWKGAGGEQKRPEQPAQAQAHDKPQPQQAAAEAEGEDEDADTQTKQGKARKGGRQAAASKRGKAGGAAAAEASGSGSGSSGGGSRVLAGLTFCVSGEFSCSQSEMKAMLVRGGGKVASTVSASVDYLVCNTPGSTKYQAALDKDKPVVTEQFIRQSLTQGKLATDSSSLFLFNPEGGEGEGEGAGMDEEGGEGGEGGEEQVFRGCVFALDDGSEAAAEFESYGARVVTEFSPAVQYVLASDVGSPLTLQAVAAGVPVVHSEWVAECLTEGELLDPWTFPMGDGWKGAGGEQKRPEQPAQAQAHDKPQPQQAAAEAEGEDEDADTQTKQGKARKGGRQAAASKRGKAGGAAAAEASGSGSGSSGGGSRVLAGLTFCVSGEFSCSQSEMKAMLVRGGGKVASTVSASVDYLVCNTPGSTKYQAALDKDKPVVTEQFIRQSLTQGKLATDSSSLFLYDPGMPAAKRHKAS